VSKHEPTGADVFGVPVPGEAVDRPAFDPLADYQPHQQKVWLNGRLVLKQGVRNSAGFRLIDDFKYSGGFYLVTWGRDLQGGWTIYKTQYKDIAAVALEAFRDGARVRLHSKRFPYLDRVERCDE